MWACFAARPQAPLPLPCPLAKKAWVQVSREFVARRNSSEHHTVEGSSGKATPTLLKVTATYPGNQEPGRTLDAAWKKDQPQRDSPTTKDVLGSQILCFKHPSKS